MTNMDCYSNDKIICPYCSTTRDIDSESDYNNEEGFEEECENCGKTFWVFPQCSWGWQTIQDCELNKEEHDWKHIGDVYPGTKTVLSECSKCGKIEYRPI